MTAFVLLSWNVNCDDADAVSQRFRTVLHGLRDRWRLLVDRPGAVLAVEASGRVLSGFANGHPTFIIGDLFARHGGRPEDPLAGDRCFEDLCGSLTTDYWGAYFALQVRESEGFTIYRDPIGMRDGISWTRSGLRVVASDPIPWLYMSASPEVAVDWLRLAGLLHDSSTVYEAPPLRGIETIPPGTLVAFDGDRREARRLWHARLFYGNGDVHSSDGASLRETVTRCVRTWLAAYPTAAVEISGGFDSALVAVTGSGIAKGINFFADGLAGDERYYARAVSSRSGIPLDEIYMPVGRLSEADVEDMPIGVCPGLGSTTLFHDRLLTQRCVAHGIPALMTGHGGDAVFFQHPTAEIAADPTFPRTDSRSYAALAKWSKESLWTVAGHAFGIPWIRSRKRRSEAIAALPLGMKSGLGSQWAGTLDGLPPAKQGQILGIAGDRSAFGPSWRSRSLTVVHPLLSQPLVELAIATDTYTLTQGRRDRALAREAFRDILPPSVACRKGKGSLGHFFGRSLAASTPFLRSFLLDGLLAGNGVLDRARLEPMLDRDFLMRFDCYGKLLSAIVTEQWARVWQDRLRAVRGSGTSSAGTH